MKYAIKAKSTAKEKASVLIKQDDIAFGITPEVADTVPNPAELFLGSLAACILKSVERFSVFMHFTYSEANIEVSATRLEKPPRMDTIQYTLTLFSPDENINIDLLKRNIEGFGTIFNTVKLAASISGEIKVCKS